LAFLRQLHDRGLEIKPEQTISGFVVDGLHKASNTIIEFYGDFWHCKPDKYRNPQQFCGWLNRTVDQQWARDRRRLGVFYGLGYKVVVIWESDWKKDPECEVDRVVASCISAHP
jgi:G:T-mismatch repair DNA endonuclease (very short patch repair protein)